MKLQRTKLKDRILPTYTKGEEIFNMTSHIVGGALGIVATVLCVVCAAIHGNVYGVISGAILYGGGKKHKWMHSIFHLFILLGSILQFFVFYYMLCSDVANGNVPNGD